MVTAATIASILSAIASAAYAISALDSTGGQISSALKQKRNKEVIDKLAKDIAADQQLARELVTIYEQRGAEYANALINQSPFGTAFKNLTKAQETNSRKLKQATAIANEIDVKGNEALTKAQSMPAGSGSIIGDLVAGGSESPTYQSRQTELNQLKESI